MEIDKLKSINDYVNFFLKKLESGADILSGEIPKFITEILNYKAFQYGITAIICLIIIISLIKKINKTYKGLKNNEKDTDEVDVGISIIGCFISAVSFGIFINSLLGFIKIMVAPRLYILEYLKEFIK